MPRSRPHEEEVFRRRFDVLGLGLSIATNDPFVDERFSTLYGAFPREAVATEAFRITRGSGEQLPRWEAFDGNARLGENQSVRTVLENVEAEICRRVLELRTDWVSLHAATVTTDRGDALIVGRSGAGKSTLSVALATQGWKVGGDDAALLDPANGLVRPIPRCFHLDAHSLQLLREIGASLPLQPPEKLFLTPSDFSVDQRRPLRIETVIILTGEVAAGASWSRVSQVETAAFLMAESGCGDYLRRDIVMYLAPLVSGVRCYSLARGDLRETSDRVAGLLDLQGGCTPC